MADSSLQEKRSFSPAGASPRYAASWMDHLTAWVRRLPAPFWVIYAGLGVAALLLELLVAWTAGYHPSGIVAYYGLLAALSPAYLLALMHHLDDMAALALDHFRRVMDVEPARFQELQYELTTLPARPALLATGLGVLYAIIALGLNILVSGRPVLLPYPPALIPLDIVYRLSLAGIMALTVYHTIHQLRLVNRIYTEHTRINLFHLGPLYALSNLAARNAIGISIITYLWFWLNTAATRGLYLPDILLFVFLGAMIIVTFVWPLLGAHRLLEREKQQLLDEVAARMETTIQELHQMIDAGVVSEARSKLKDTLDGLVIEQGVIHKLRTWPWRTETASGVGAALLAPIVIWLIQRLLERLGL